MLSKSLRIEHIDTIQVRCETIRKAVLARLPIAAQRQTSDLHCHPSLQDCVRTSLPQTCGRHPRD